jgi:hypothetical protein
MINYRTLTHDQAASERRDVIECADDWKMSGDIDSCERRTITPGPGARGLRSPLMTSNRHGRL